MFIETAAPNPSHQDKFLRFLRLLGVKTKTRRPVFKQKVTKEMKWGTPTSVSLFASSGHLARLEIMLLSREVKGRNNHRETEALRKGDLLGFKVRCALQLHSSE